MNPISWFLALQSDAHRWRAHCAYRSAIVGPLLSLDLAPCTRAACLAAASAAGLAPSVVGEVALVLWMRGGRGTVLLDDVVSDLRARHGVACLDSHPPVIEEAPHATFV